MLRTVARERQSRWSAMGGEPHWLRWSDKLWVAVVLCAKDVHGEPWGPNRVIFIKRFSDPDEREGHDSGAVLCRHAGFQDRHDLPEGCESAGCSAGGRL